MLLKSMPLLLLGIVVAQISSDTLIFPRISELKGGDRVWLEFQIHNETIGLALGSGKLRANFENIRCRFFNGHNGSQVAAVSVCNGQEVNGLIQMSTRKSFSIEFHQRENVHYLRRLPMRTRRKRQLDFDGWDGYFLGKLWNVQETQENESRNKTEKTMSKRGEIVCRGLYCEYFKVKRDEPKWIEIVVALDPSVTEFHGDKKSDVMKFVLTLFNIVGAIYSDPTLGANLNFAIVDIIFVDKTDTDRIIVDGKSKESLSNVNEWNKKLWQSRNQPHDVGVWLTRRDIGGPSGFAPVGGMCDPNRSCALIKEEGLSSAFIIAHELGHALGLTHDGDLSSGNDCSQEAKEGSVMAPMVGATFSFFHWSTCSSGEYHYKSSSWNCLRNFPPKTASFIRRNLEVTYSLDEQCRMEFGEGFGYCESFQLSDPCTHLWCSHKTTPDVCKTKKGPPMDRTLCGEEQWCMNGLCEPATQNNGQNEGVRHNSRSGGWSEWSPWGDCSRTCGGGATFRTRLCNNPRPAYGGEPCYGDNEEFKLCNTAPCPEQTDFRADQCQDLFEFVSRSENDDSWVPHETNGTNECKLTCFNRDSGEVYHTGENVIDGTRCSYDEKKSNLCIQGHCVTVGCDMILNSPLKEDECGVCGGDGSKCTRSLKKIAGKLSPGDVTEVFTFPEGARNMRISLNKENLILVIKEDFGEIVVFTGDPKRANPMMSFVTNGARFYIANGKNLEARGPLLSPLVISVTTPQDLDLTKMAFEVQIEFTESYGTKIERNSEVLGEWVVHGWSKCSRECGGGIQRILFKCEDKGNRRRLPKRHCNDMGTRMKSLRRTRRCNTFSCDFQWVTSKWEECSHSCGTTGMRVREAFCVPRAAVLGPDEPEEQIWKKMVDPRRCPGRRPTRFQECNRIPCPAKWRPLDWSQCGLHNESDITAVAPTAHGPCVGIQRQRFRCVPPPGEIFYDCGLEPSHEIKCIPDNCYPDKIDCTDESELCADKLLLRYCISPSYRQRCCQSCSNYM